MVSGLVALASITPAHAQQKGGAKPAAAAPAKPAGGGAKGGAKPDAKAAAKPDAKAAAKPDAKAAAKPDAKGAKPDAKAAAKPDKDACATEPKPKLSDAKKKDEAKKAYKSGETKFDKGEYEPALVCYKLAESYIPGANPKYKIAASLDKLGKVTEAVAAYEAFLTAVGPTPEDKYKEKIADAKTRVDALKATPSKVKLAVGPDGLPNLKITLDGMPQTGAELTVPPGKHTIAVSADGYDTLTQPLEVGYAETKDMPLTLTKTPEPVVTAAPTATATATAVAMETATATATATAPVLPPTEPRSPVPAYVTLGLAGAGAIVGGIFGGMALGSKGEFDTLAADGKTSAKDLTAKADETDRNALIADMSFAVALTFGVTGAVLLLSDAPASAPAKAGAATPQKTKKAANVLQRGFIAPYATPNGGGAAARFTF